METEEKENHLTCARCGRELDLGVDAVALEYGVIGPRGFVSLDDRRLFCDEDCLRRHLGGDEVERLPRRIP